jgi:hypothetical protein
MLKKFNKKVKGFHFMKFLNKFHTTIEPLTWSYNVTLHISHSNVIIRDSPKSSIIKECKVLINNSQRAMGVLNIKSHVMNPSTFNISQDMHKKYKNHHILNKEKLTFK